MAISYARHIGAELNEMNRSLGALVGIAQGLICDKHLNDQEIHFLDAWLGQNEAIASTWPGDVIHARVREVIADRIVTEEERTYLIDTLREFVGGPVETLSEPVHVTELGFDRVDRIDFAQRHFCLTGDFVYGPRESCKAAIEKRGGIVASVTKKLGYLVVGSRGSNEWKHGSFGTKFEKAMRYKRDGCPILIVREDRWAASL